MEVYERTNKRSDPRAINQALERFKIYPFLFDDAHVQMEAEAYLAMAINVLDVAQIPIGTISYFSRVTFPILIAMRGGPVESGVNAVSRFVEEVIDLHQKDAQLFIPAQTQKTINFFEHREHVMSLIHQILQQRLQELPETSPLRAVMLFGSMEKGNIHLYSDIDIIPFGTEYFSEEKQEPYPLWISAYIESVHESIEKQLGQFPDMKIGMWNWTRLGVVDMHDMQKGNTMEALASLLNYPDFRYKVIGKTHEDVQKIEEILESVT